MKFNYRKKIKTPSKLVEVVKNLKRNNKTIVMSGGVFDILHPGHTRYLEKTKNMGDILIVAVNSDSSTRKIKGPKRPINNQKIRTEMLAALESVDYVVIFNQIVPNEIIELIKPNIWVKGGHYKIEEMPEAKIINQYGGKIKIIPTEEGFSVSGLVNKIIKQEPLKIHQKNSYER